MTPEGDVRMAFGSPATVEWPRETRAYHDVQEAVDAGHKYSIVVADPPWAYKYWCPSGGKSSRSAESHYDVMSPADLARLPVKRLLHSNAVLFMWVTGPFMYESREVVEGWGFEFSTIAFVWYKVTEKGKDKFTMGHTSRPSAEFVVMGRRGSLPCLDHGVHQAIDDTRDPEVVRTRPRRHSQKPDIVLSRIVEMYGDLPRIELFRRGPPAHTWDAVGFETVNHPTLDPFTVSRDSGARKGPGV